MGHNPLCNVLVELWVEDGLLQPGQRPICIHQAALHEHVTVALEVIARGAGRQRGHFFIEETSKTLRSCAAARVGIHLLHAAHVAKLSLILAILACTGACFQPILLTDGAGAASIEADLSISMAGGEVGLGLRCGALGTDSVAHSLVSAL